MARRWTLARDLMAREGLDAMLLFGNSGVNRHNQANVFWLSNHLDLHHAYLLAPHDVRIDAALYVGLTNHVPQARRAADIPIVQWGEYDPARTVAARLREIGLVRGRIGLVGVNHTFGIGMPFQHHALLAEMLPGLTLVDVTKAFVALRAVKSDEEIARLRRAAALTDRAIDALRHEVRPGLPEYALPGIIEGAYRREGGDPHIAFVRSMPMDDPNGCVPAQDPSDRTIRRGDVVITEISATLWGYSGQIHRPIFVGTDPTSAWRRMFETAAEAFHRMAKAMRPGARESDIVAAASLIGERGYAVYDDLVHGYGVDIHPPVIDRSCVVHWDRGTLPSPGGQRFERNMAVVIQPNPITPDERMGLQVGALTVVTDGGAASLHQIPLEPVIAEA
ncbi:MAG TPA: M24 family metallopeptidase [bacterium]